MARAALEAALKELDPYSDRKIRLDQRIANVSPKVSSSLVQVLTVLRYGGNTVLHDGAADAIVAEIRSDEDGQMAEVILGAINQLADELVARPREASALYELIPENVRTQAQIKIDAAQSEADPAKKSEPSA